MKQQPKFCRPCKDAGIRRVATRILRDLGNLPCCTQCASKHWKPSGCFTPISPGDLSDDAIAEVMEMRARDALRKPWAVCGCGCGAPLPIDYGAKHSLPGHVTAPRGRESAA